MFELLFPEDSEAMRFVRLSVAARAYDAQKAQGAQFPRAERAYCLAREQSAEVQNAMLAGDAVDGSLMRDLTGDVSYWRIEGQPVARVHALRAFIGVQVDDLYTMAVYG